MSRTFPIAALVAIASVGSAGRALADSVTLNYQVTVNFRHDFTLPPSQWHWAPMQSVSFPLSMTFDPGVTQTLQGDGFSTVFFGFPQFSAVPLSGAGTEAGDPTGGTFIGNYGAERSAYADGFLGTSTEFTASLYGPRLFANIAALLPPGVPGDAGRFLAAMRSPGLQFYFFDYALDWRSSSGTLLDQPVFAPNSAGFLGHALLIEAAPVPEPTTMVLLGTGLVAVAARARRRWGRHQRS